MQLKDRIAIVTGGASGLGRAIAERFAHEGATVVILDKNEDGIDRTVAAIRAAGGRAEGVAGNVSDQSSVRAVVAGVVGRHGRIDILVNNAGVTRYRPFLTATAEDWNAVLDVDLKGVFFCTQAVAPQMIKQGSGRVINISSAQGTGTTPLHTAGSPGGSSAYSAAKAAVIQLTKTLARELGPSGINVNCVAPGSFLTPLTSATRTPEEVAEHVSQRAKCAVLNRVGRPEELAGAVVFLASDDASFIAGHTIQVDGGRIDRM